MTDALPPLTLGDVAADGVVAEGWGAFAEASGDYALAVVEAACAPDLMGWLREASPRPEVVVVGVPPEEEGAYLEAGAAEALPAGAGTDAVARALRRAAARGRARAREAEARGSYEAQFGLLLRALPDVIARLRRDGLALDFHVPESFATEFAPEVILGRRLHDVLPGRLAEQFDDAVARIEAGADLATYRYDILARGETRHREVRLVPLAGDEVISIVRDVTPEVEAELRRDASASELEASRTELRALAVHQQTVRENERARLSREVHDTLGQHLTALRYAFGWFGRRLADDPDAQKRLADARALLDDLIQTVRQVASDLRPGVLDDFGLIPALEWMCTQLSERTGIDIRIEASGVEAETKAAEIVRVLAPEVETAAFRIVQEALTNVARHAHADCVIVRVTRDGGDLHVRIIDDGVGFDAHGPAGGSLGMVGMRERAHAFGGTLRIASTPGFGTSVDLSFPLPDPA